MVKFEIYQLFLFWKKVFILIYLILTKFTIVITY